MLKYNNEEIDTTNVDMEDDAILYPNINLEDTTDLSFVLEGEENE